MLKRIKLKGFKSIKELDLEMRPLNILIGANGVGKSNLISFFKMLNEMMATRLQQYIGVSGGAQTLLHFGAKVTPQIEAQLEFENEVDLGRAKRLDSRLYNLRLFHAAGDTLIFAEETLSFLQINPKTKRQYEPKIDSLGAGHQETKIKESIQENVNSARSIEYLLSRCRVYHFHDTSSTAGVRQSCYVGDNRWLMPNAENLAALLLRFRHEDGGKAYQRIISTIRLIAPFFDDFDLRPKNNRVMLEWRHQGSDQVFGSHQLSDGTLRAICLTTLLLQPVGELPELIIVDEPELGLHPYALNVVAAMFSEAAQNTQILISTQSSSFLDNFEPEDVITIDREAQESKFTRLNSANLEVWLEEYSLGEIWEKNIINGGPH
jgi:predicted ATPase